MSQNYKEHLKVGLIGLGKIATAQTVPACFQIEELDLVAVCRRTESKLHRLAEQFHILHRYADYHELLAHPGLDAVLITTGPAEGPKIILDALRRGLHVFTEKPLALDSSTALELVRAAREAGRVASVGYMKLLYPAYARAKALLAENALGLSAALQAHFWYQLGQRPGSAFHNDTHFYALAPGLLGPVAEVYARRFTDSRGHATAITLAFESGSVGTLTLSSLASWDYAWHESVQLITERGHVLIATNGRGLYHFDPKAPETATFSGQTVSIHWRESDGFVDELRAFAQSILQAKQAPVPFDPGLQALLLSEAVERSVQEGRPVPVRLDL